MTSLLLVFALGFSSDGRAASRWRPTPMRESVSKNLIPWPKAYGVRPETLEHVKSAPAPKLWTEEWTEISREFNQQAYLLFTVNQHEPSFELHQEIVELLKILGRLNALARTPYSKDSGDCRRALDLVVVGGLFEAIDLVRRQAPEFDEARARTLAERVARLAADTEALERATREAKIEWKQTDYHARIWRAVQYVGLIVGAHVAAHGLGAQDTDVVRDLSTVIVFAWFFDLFDSVLPVTFRFDWRDNLVAAPAAECEKYLTPGATEGGAVGPTSVSAGPAA